MKVVVLLQLVLALVSSEQGSVLFAELSFLSDWLVCFAFKK